MAMVPRVLVLPGSFCTAEKVVTAVGAVPSLVGRVKPPPWMTKFEALRWKTVWL